MTWLDAGGWGGSAPLAYSLLRTRVPRPTSADRVACVLLSWVHAAPGTRPRVALNRMLAVSNVGCLVTLLRVRHPRMTGPCHDRAGSRPQGDAYVLGLA